MNLFEISESEWRNLYGQLYAFTDFLIKHTPWFRKGGSSSYIQGKTADDYVMEAVTRYLEHPEKYDGTKRGLDGYLKCHIIRTLVGNDARSKENSITTEWSQQSGDGRGDGLYEYVDEVLPSVYPFFDDEIDYQNIIEDLRKAIAHDKCCRTIFEGVCVCGKPRREIIAENGWSDEAFDNGMKRLNRARVKVGKKYQLNPRNEQTDT
jgi:hypothetical protein